MKTAAVFCFIVLCITGNGCGFPVSNRQEIPLEPQIIEAAEIVQSVKNEIREKSLQKGESAEQTECAESNVVTPQKKHFLQNKFLLSWIAFFLIYILLWGLEKCSNWWGIPSERTMAKISDYFIRCLPFTQKMIFKVLRAKHLKKVQMKKR